MSEYDRYCWDCKDCIGNFTEERYCYQCKMKQKFTPNSKRCEQCNNYFTSNGAFKRHICVLRHLKQNDNKLLIQLNITY
jgi:hypothetical protein